ncbi:cofactor-independent phosphoglycerate mutase [Actinidia rufa]|uniref:Cofactor-independent phosphoglycerate mutase n=1 Tax=Actinidia rufa TaxID=165716 RepID=A0A7J0H7A6_9ERIC|nr:cofactor-independent phosphoglycerate mutase [Actinidia rufa]
MSINRADQMDMILASFILKAIDDAGHDKASIFKVKGLEAVDRAIGQLAKLLWQAESTGNFQYFICIKDFVGAVGGESSILETSLEPFPLPTTKPGEDLADNLGLEEAKRSVQLKAFCGDSVCKFDEIEAARGCLGRFPGGER